MSLLVLLAVVVITAGSRVAALTLLPEPDGALAVLADRLPAPLFAALAASSLIGSSGQPPDPAMLAAAACAIASARWRSLLATLGAGLGGYLVGMLVW